MGPITLIDKSTIQALSFDEVLYLDRYYSIVIPPILMRELHSTLAKNPEPDKDWHKVLSILAAKVDSPFNSYIPPHAITMARENLLGQDVPMTGQIPLVGGRTLRARDGTYGVVFEEPAEKSMLRQWKKGEFSELDKKHARKIREMDHAINLSSLQKEIKSQLRNFPDFPQFSDLVTWLDNVYFNQTSQELHLRYAALTLLDPSETELLIERWKAKGSPLFSEFCPYAFYFYRCSIIFYVGLGKGHILTSKSAKTHLDMKYIYYLPFCMVFISSDKFQLNFAKFFVRKNQSIIRGCDLKKDLNHATEYFQNLTKEQKKIITGEFGNYPPDQGAPLTALIWNDHMMPRPKEKGNVPELSKEQNENIVQQMHKALKDSVNIDTNQTNDPSIATKFRNIGIVERGIHFVNEVLNLLGTSFTDDWNTIRESFDHHHVKKIYDLHADIWRPDDDHLSLAEGIRKDDRVKFLYLGEIEPEEISKKIWRWALHFDQILIPDPFLSPWAMNNKYNPLVQPVQYETDTLKLVYLIMILYPLIMAKKVVFIPDPSDFNPGMKKSFMELIQKNLKNQHFGKLLKADMEKFRIHEAKTQMRTYSRLPEPQRTNAVKSLFKMDIENHLRALELMRRTDPLCLDRESNLGESEIIITRSGASFETSIILSAMYGATPMSSLNIRYNQFRGISTQPSEHTMSILNLFGQTPGFSFLDPFFSTLMAEKGALSGFREIFAALLALSPIPEEFSLETMTDALKIMEEDCYLLAEIFAKSSGYDGTKLVGKFQLEILCSQTGFVTEDISALASAWFPGQNLSYPKHFIKLPE